MPEKNNDIYISSAQGFLIVRVTESESAIPISNALVTVTKQEEEGAKLVGVSKTDESGLTRAFSLNAPLNKSEYSSDLIPYEIYFVRLSHPGYYIEDNHMSQIFAGVSSHLTVNMIPLPEDSEKEVIVY